MSGDRDPTPTARWGAQLDRASLLLVFLTLLAFSLHKIVAFDLWWQLAAGAWILEHGPPRTDPFSYGFPDRRWIELRWLYHVAIHALADRFGLNALIAAKCALLLATLAVLRAAVRSRHGWIAPAVLLLAVCLMFPRLRVRPELMSFLWMAVTLLCLERYRRGGSGRWLAPLPAVGVLWSNTHTLWALGPALIWSLAAGELAAGRLGGRFPWLAGDPHPIAGVRLRRLAWTGVAFSATGLATPYLVDGALYPITLLQQIRTGSATSLLIQELRSPFLNLRPDFFHVSYLAAIYLSFGSFLLRPRRLVLARALWWGGFLLLSMLSERNVSLFGIVAAVVTAANLRDWMDAPAPEPGRLRRAAPWLARAAVLGCGAVLVPAVVTDWFWRAHGADQAFGFGVVERRVPIRAMAFVRAHQLPTPVMNVLSDGGYILYREGPKSVFVDGRLEVYGQRNLELAIRATQSGPEYLALLGRHGIETAVLNIPFQTEPIRALEAHPGWAAVYYDESHVVYVERNERTRARVDALAIDWSRPTRREVRAPAFDTPPDWLAGVFPHVPDVTGLRQTGQLLILMGSLEAARERFAEAVRLRPDDQPSLLHLGILAHAFGDAETARSALARVHPRTLQRRDVLQLRGFVAEARGQHAEARDFLRAAAGTAADR